MCPANGWRSIAPPWLLLTIEIEPQIEARLRAQAAARGVAVETEAARLLSFATFTDEEREELEDELDVAAANRARGRCRKSRHAQNVG